MDGSMVDQVRSFNRSVTQRVGALNDRFLAQDRALAEARLLWASLAPLAAWILLNRKFMGFFRRERGWSACVLAWGVTFLDHHVMLLGILSGFASALFGRRSNPDGAERAASSAHRSSRGSVDDKSGRPRET
jgi:hypothetical protein